MSYISAIAVDFGSSNSGVARIDHFENGKLTYTTPTLPYSDGHYAKDASWFFIEPSLLQKAERNWDSLTDSDFRILSRLNRTTESPNVIWGRYFIQENADKIQQEKWIEFKYFKMMIYKGVPYRTSIKDYPIELVVKLFLRIIKIDCLTFECANAKRTILSEQIKWGVTIPSIWTDENKRMMLNICGEIFGEHVRILSEPEGPVIAERIHSGSGDFVNIPGHKSFVIDCGGGTTDLCLLEDKEIGRNGNLSFKLLASSDGIGLGGNNIDEEFIRYFLKFITKGLHQDQGGSYDRFSYDELKETILTPYLSASIKNSIEFENEWLFMKHGMSDSFKVPKNYRIWLKENGHSSVAERIRDIVAGDVDFGIKEMKNVVFLPVFTQIANVVGKFLSNNIDLISQDIENNFSVVFAGGMSLSNGFRDLMKQTIREVVNCEFKETNLAMMSNSVSASIMEGASYVLLNRHSLQRKAKFYIYDMFSNISYSLLKDAYSKLGLKIGIGELNAIADDDAEKNSAQYGMIAMPIAIKDDYFVDYETDFIAKNENQKNIENIFYKSDQIIVLPVGNVKAQEIERFKVENVSKNGYHCTIDFNENEIGNCIHFYITRSDTGELLYEKNLPI